MSDEQRDPEVISASNGLNASTGDYFFPPRTLDEMAAVALAEYDEIVAQRAGAKPTKEHLFKDHVDELRWRHDNVTAETYAPVAGVEPKNLNETGWGVIFPAGNDPKVLEIRNALEPLLKLRQRQALEGHGKEHYYREFIGDKGYSPGWTKIQFLEDNNASYGPADPENVPYYLLIVGDPDTIPYSFQYQLDVQYAVGRIYFDTVAEYEQYARSVVRAESEEVTLPRRAVLFGVRNDDDPSTELSARLLVTPLARELDAGQEPFIKRGMPRCEVQTIMGAEATKERLLDLIGSREPPPALLFTASHGAAFNKGDSRMEPHQGALVCQDWPGPKVWGRTRPIPQEHYLAGDDLGDDVNLLGMIAFHFACFGAGTPEKDDFSYTKSMPIAPHSFVARLPQRMLGLPRGGVLAVVGHVERAWDYSFKWGAGGSQTQTFRSTMLQLMDGYPVGAAMEFINQRYAQMSTEITDYEHKVRGGLDPDKYKLVGMWAANNDARSYVVLGDPAVKIVRAGTGRVGPERPAVETLVVNSAAAPPRPEPHTAAPPEPRPEGEAEPAAVRPASAHAAASDCDLSAAHEGAKANVQELIDECVARLRRALSDTVSGDAGVKVLTYAGDDLKAVAREGARQEDAAELLALTHVEANGNTTVCVPRSGGELDPQTWRIHKESVEQALAHRAEMVRALGGALADLIEKLKPL